MNTLFAASQLDNALGQTKDVLGRFTDTFFSARSIISFIVAISLAIILGRLMAAVMRKFARSLSRRADRAVSLQEVNRLRRIETFTVLSVALIRMILVVIALYVWWVYAHPNQQPTAIISATALVIIIGGATVGPIMRDLAYGGVMMAEHWFGVGDYVKVEPFSELEGIVERVTLRSLRIRGINGEIIWLNNQNIQGVRVSPKGVRTIAIDLFVTNLDRGLDIVENTNLRLPPGSLMVVRPLHIMSQNKVGENMWHIVVIGETAPGREWLLKDYAVRIMNEQDEINKRKVLATEPIARYADSDAERRFARTIQNARKSSLRKRHFPLPDSISKHKKTEAARKKPSRKIQ